MSDKYRYIDTVPGELANGQPLGPGEFVHLDAEVFDDPFNKDLLDSGKLIAAEESAPKAAKTTRAKGKEVT